MALPTWPGADAVYTKALRALELHGATLRPVRGRVTPSDEMNDLIDALNKGDEERLKGLLLRYA